MKSSKHIKTLMGSVCIIISFIIIGCTVKVPLSNYNPVFTGEYSGYKGKRVFLENFDNQAKDTSIWHYYSLDKKFNYSKSRAFSAQDQKGGATYIESLHNYFWYAFRDAFTKLGMLVSNVDNPDLAAPTMWVTLLSITDVEYYVSVTVQKRGITVFTEKYTIQELPLAEKDRNPAALEQRAYRMTNRLIESIIKDPGFQEGLTEP